MARNPDLSTAQALIRKKMRQAHAADRKAFKKAYDLKDRRKNGYTRKRSGVKKSTVEATNDSLAAAGRNAGEVRERGQAPDNAQA